MYVEWINEGMEHHTCFPQEGSHGTTISKLASEHTIIPVKDKLPCLN